MKDRNNKELTKKALKEILDVHRRYGKSSARSFKEAKELIGREFSEFT